MRVFCVEYIVFHLHLVHACNRALDDLGCGSSHTRFFFLNEVLTQFCHAFYVGLYFIS